MNFLNKKVLLALLFTLLLEGCYSSVGASTAMPVGKYGSVGSSVSVGSDGMLHGNVGVGTAIRL